MDILIGLLLLVVGVAVCFTGLRVFFAALPIIGFFLGFFIGTIGMQSLFGEGFLSTATSWVVGIVLGLIFAVISYLWWYVGALLSAGAVGASLGTGLLHLFNIEIGLLLFIFGLAGFILFFIGALVLNLPIYIVVVNTAFAGALLTIAGFLLIFDRINVDELGAGASVSIVGEGWFYSLVWIVLATAGIMSQLRMIDSVALPAERYTPARAV